MLNGTVNQERYRLRRLAERIQKLQQETLELVEARDELIADLLIERAMTGDQIGEVAGLSQPRTAQIKAAVLTKRAEAVKAAKREQARNRRKSAKAAEHVAAETAA